MTDATGWSAERGAWPDAGGDYEVRIYVREKWKGKVWSPDEAEAQALIDKVNDPGPLPDGVYRFAGGFFMPGHWRPDAPEGWRIVDDDGACFEVEPIPPAPDTVKVPWHEAFGRTLPDGRLVAGARRGDRWPNGAVLVPDVLGHSWIGADEHGMVEVLPEVEP